VQTPLLGPTDKVGSARHFCAHHTQKARDATIAVALKLFFVDVWQILVGPIESIASDVVGGSNLTVGRWLKVKGGGWCNWHSFLFFKAFDT
jgi:hypothetical protein